MIPNVYLVDVLGPQRTEQYGLTPAGPDTLAGKRS